MKFVSVKGAAEHLNISIRAIQKRCKRLGFDIDSKGYLIPEEVFKSWLLSSEPNELKRTIKRTKRKSKRTQSVPINMLTELLKEPEVKTTNYAASDTIQRLEETIKKHESKEKGLEHELTRSEKAKRDGLAEIERLRIILNESEQRVKEMEQEYNPKEGTTETFTDDEYEELQKLVYGQQNQLKLIEQYKSEIDYLRKSLDKAQEQISNMSGNISASISTLKEKHHLEFLDKTESPDSKNR